MSPVEGLPLDLRRRSKRHGRGNERLSWQERFFVFKTKGPDVDGLGGLGTEANGGLLGFWATGEVDVEEVWRGEGHIGVGG